MNFNIRQKGRKSPRDQSPRKLPKSPAIMASGNSTILVSENPKNLCNRLQVLLQEKQTANNSKIFDEEINAIEDTLLE